MPISWQNLKLSASNNPRFRVVNTNDNVINLLSISFGDSKCIKLLTFENLYTFSKISKKDENKSFFVLNKDETHLKRKQVLMIQFFILEQILREDFISRIGKKMAKIRENLS